MDVRLSSAIGALALAMLATAPGHAAQSKCLAGKTKCVAGTVAGLLKCEGLAKTPGKPAHPNTKSCVDKAKAKFDGGADPTKGCFDKLESKSGNDCPTFDDTASVEAQIDACVAQLAGAVDPESPTQS